MISNKQISKALNLCAQLMELHNENPFKCRSYSNAAFKIGKLDFQLAALQSQEILNLEGIGKTIGNSIIEFLLNGTFEELTRMAAITPPGVMDMMAIKGIGPKKIAIIWKELNIESLGELLYACNENRLLDLKGFGKKTQEQIIKSIEFKISSTGKSLYAVAETVALDLLDFLAEKGIKGRFELTGEIRRKCEIIEMIEILSTNDFSTELEEFNLLHNPSGIPIHIIPAQVEDFEYLLFESTSSLAHKEYLKNHYGVEAKPGLKNEAEIYKNVGLNFIVPEMREGGNEFEWAKLYRPEDLIKLSDIKGVLHCHSNWSDGINSLAEMAQFCKSQGFEYLGICDHSQSAFYARGLKDEQVFLQHEEINKLNMQLAPFRIFKGIESDILNTGALDYPDQILESFDFIVASVHSNLKMDKEKAMARLIRAIENPYTTILGHMTGRLLLSRQGYPLDYLKIIDACAANNVVIELNANPYRLDMDWRYIPYALEKGVKISINPDAHQKETIHDMHFGVSVARKAGLTRDFTLNTMGLNEIENFFLSIKKSKTQIIKTPETQ